MATINSVVWEIEPHTEAKHAILKKYLGAWLPIMGWSNKRIAYIDGFAGPGKYSGGEDGSPIIAIKSVTEHRLLSDKTQIQMLFIEESGDRCIFLETEIKKIAIPSNITYNIRCDRFEKAMDEILKMIESNDASNLIPSFIFIDPFGFSGIPLSIIKRIMKNPKCEVLITFMYDEISRFLSLPGNEKHFTATFGSEEWKKAPSDPAKKLEFLHQLYNKQLESSEGANIKFVRSFKMKNKFNKTDYFLFFGTNSAFGLEKMKEAMWNVDKAGSFEFSDASYNPYQGMLFDDKPNFFKLKKSILEKFKGREVSSRELGDFIVIETPFLRSHYKTSILKPMESATPPEINIIGGRTRRGTYPDGCIIKFL